MKPINDRLSTLKTILSGIVVVLLLISIQTEAFCQTGQGDNWFYGNRAGVTFISGSPAYVSGGATNGTNNLEGTATISDSSGNLLFYTDGQTVWNKNHSVMETGLKGHYSATQSGVIVPHPTSADTFYIFTIDATQNNLANGLQYSIVDMSLNSGLGDIPSGTKNQNITPSGVLMAEKITAVRHCNNVDIWVIAHGYSRGTSTAGKKFYSFLLTPNGLNSTPVVSTVGTEHKGGDGGGYGNSRGYMKASPDGRKIALAITYDGCSSYWANWCSSTSGAFEVFDFDYTTGKVSNPIKLTNRYKGAYGVEFSPNGNVLYGSTWASYGGSNKIYQWDLTKTSQTAIQNSERTIANEATSYGRFGAMQLASDGRIYIVRAYENYLSHIKFPNKLGSSCAYSRSAVTTSSASGRYGLPTFVQSYFDPNIGYSYVGNFEDMVTKFTIADSVRIDSVHWKFFDSSATSDTSSLYNPIFQFSDTGTYRVRLIIWRCNIIDTVLHDIIIYPRPDAAFSINDTLQCEKDNVFEFTNNTTIESGSVTRYFWDFGDGDTSNLENPTHHYDTTGVFTVKLLAESDQGGLDSTTKQVKIIYSPNAYAYVNDTLQCLKGNIFYIDNASTIKTSSDLSYYWEFGNGDTSTSQYLTPKSYSSADTFLLLLITTSDSGCVDTFQQNLYVRPMPTAGFSVNDTGQCLRGNNFIFTDTTKILYDTLSYYWTFGNGDTSTSQNPIYSYSSTGNYQVKQRVESNFGCSDSAYQNVALFPMPEADFAINDSGQCRRSNLFRFYDSSGISSGSLSYHWSFGDTNTSTLQNPQHQYGTSDTFTVSLVAISDKSCRDTLTQKAYVYPMPQSDFSINDSSQCLTSNYFEFTNHTTISSGNLSYYWVLGDGSNATDTNTSNTYSKDDSFEVLLIATSSLGCKDSTSKTNIVFPMPVANFSIQDSAQCLDGNYFSFSDSSYITKGTVDSFFWDFNDGSTSTQQNPNHSYSLHDTFQARLIVKSDQSCADTSFNSLIVHPMPLDLGEQPYLRTLDSGMVVYYPLNGNANDSGSNNFNASISGATSTSGVIGQAYSFDGSDDYIEKTYEPELTLGDQKWTVSTWFKIPTTLPTQHIKIIDWYRCGVTDCNTNDKARYSMEINKAGTVTFKVRDNTSDKATTATSSLIYNDNQWHFATGIYDPVSDSIHLYVDNCLQTSVYAKLDSVSDWNYSVPLQIGRHYVTGWGSPTQYFKGAIDEVRIYDRALNQTEVETLYKLGRTLHVQVDSQYTCKSDSTYIKLISPQKNVKYELVDALSFNKIGKAQRSYCADTLFFSTGGVYDTSFYKILATDVETNCAIYLDTIITIYNYPQPNPDFSIDTSIQCFNENEFNFTNQSTISSGNLTYLWNFGDSATSTSTQASHVYSYVDTQAVKLIATSDHNCKDSVTKSIEVLPSPKLNINLELITLCAGSPVQINLSGGVDYHWSTTTGFISTNSDSDTVIVSPPSTTTYRIAGENTFGCLDTIETKINVFPLPVVDAGDNDTICYTESTQLNGSGGLIYEWSPGETLSDSTIANPIATPEKTTTYYLQATNPANELIVNGDFSSGNSSFTSAYTYTTNLVPEGTYMVGTNPKSYHNSFATCSDHTSGSGNMMIINGATTKDQVVWKQTINVTKNTSYAFSTWITSVVGSNPAKLRFAINGVQMGSNFSPTTTTCDWDQFYVTWNSDTNTVATISIINKNTVAGGNDFALDDISFAPLCSNIDSVTIVVNPKPVNDFSINDSTQCFNNNEFIITNTTSIDSGSLSYQWDLGDGTNTSNQHPTHSFVTDDTFTIQLISTSDKNCKDTISKNVYVFPNPQMTISVNDSQQCFATNSFVFANNSTINSGTQTYAWDFGDQKSSTLDEPTHVYANDDSFLVRLTATSDLGCTDSAFLNTYVFPSPETDFSIDDSNQCFNGNHFNFSNASTINTGSQNYLWNFGDGNTSTFTSPGHQYATDDTFTVKLLATSNLGCKDSLEKTVYVFPNPEIDFSINDSQQCYATNNFVFTNLSTINSGSQSYHWDFGDQKTSVGTSPTHQYDYFDTFRVSLVATSDLNCQDSTAKYTYVFASPVAGFNINDSAQCLRYNEFTLSNTSSIGAGSNSYLWTLSDGSTYSQQDVKHSFSSDDTFNIKLLVSSNLNCKDSVEKTSITHPMPETDFSINDSDQCLLGNSFEFTNLSSINSGSNQYLWRFGDNDSSSSTSTTHSYLNHDTFTVELLAVSDQKCRDSIDRKLIVFPMPQAAFGINDSSQCFRTNYFRFSDSSHIAHGNISYKWYFGDQAGSLGSTLQNPVHEYNNYDTFLVSMVTTSGNNCQDSTSKYVIVNPMPVADFTINDSSQCLSGNLFKYSNQSTIPYGSMTHDWVYGDGDTSKNSTDGQHTYINHDTFSVMLTAISAENCHDTLIKTAYVHPMPRADFTINDSMQCYENNEFIYTDASYLFSGSMDYYWNLGDNTLSNTSNITHQYTGPDTFRVNLKLETDQSCLDSIEKTVYVFPMPDAQYAIYDSSQCFEKNAFGFTNLSVISSGNLSYCWSFGDGDTSNLKDPIHSYAQADTFNVKLVVKSDQGCMDSIEGLTYVHVHPEPNAGFYALDSAQCLSGNLFEFMNTSTITSGYMNYTWDFGDGSSSVIDSPTYSYNNHDTVLVKLMAISDWGCKDSILKPMIIYPMPEADFGISDSSQCLYANTFDFYDSSSIVWGKLTNYWDFGDGDTAFSQNSAHKYPNHDTFTVKLLSVSKMNCADSQFKKVYVHPEPTADFHIDVPVQCLRGNAFQFTDSSSIYSGNLSPYWYFDDGDTATQHNPLHTYSFYDTFYVKLRISSAEGCRDSINKRVVVHPMPESDFSINDSQQCLNENLYTFTNESDIRYGLLNYAWYFDDGDSTALKDPHHQFNYDDTFLVSLIATSLNGCIDTMIKPAYVFPSPVPSFKINNSRQCFNGNYFEFTNETTINTGSASYTWDFGDGTVLSATDTSHVYQTEDTFMVTLIANSDLNCPDTTSRTVNVFPSPEADFVINDSSQCLTDNYFTFDNLSSISSGYMTYEWKLGDGTQNSDSNTQRSYLTHDTFLVKLITTSGLNCKDSLVKNVYVHPMPVADFTINDSSQCLRGNDFLFTNTSGIAHGTNSYQWDFGDGQTSTQENPNIQYVNFDTFSIQIITVSAEGCGDTTYQQAFVHPMPEASFDIQDTSICLRGNRFVFTNQTTIAHHSLSYDWDFGDLNKSQQSNPVHSYSDFGNYVIKLVSTSSLNCQDSTERQVYVRPMPKADFNINDSTQCLDGNNFVFTNNSSVAYGSMTHKWYHGNGDSSATENATETYDTDGKYNVMLISTSQAYNCPDSIQKEVVVHPMPVANFIFETPCLMDSIFFTDQSSIKSPDRLDQWQWDFSGSGSSADQNPWHIFSQSGDHDVALTVVTDKGCRDSITKTLTFFDRVVAPILDRVTVEDSFILIEWNEVTIGKPKNYVLERSLDYSNFKVIGQFAPGNDNYLDQSVDVNNKSYIYRIQVKDSCDYISPYSNIGKSILLEVNNDDEYPKLSWTEYEDWSAGIERYDINVDNDRQNRKDLVNSVTPFITEYEDSRTQINQTNYCYTISAYRNGDNQVSNSNKMCIETPLNLQVPNAFTPNGDGLNDSFRVKGTHLLGFKMQIYNRWGELLFETTDVTRAWDGKFKGELVPPGVYYLYIDAKGTMYQRERIKSSVTVLR